MIAFAYYGGKQRLVKHLLPLLPTCDHYIEPFCGSAAVLLNRKPSPIETLNDLNGDIVNFFRVLREQADQLVKMLQLTPYARQEFFDAWEQTEDPVERARRWFVRIQMDIAKAGARKDAGWSSNVKYCPGEHSYAPRSFRNKTAGLYGVAERLSLVQMENRPALKLIQKYDTPGTLFYIDPPYMPETRTSANDYRFEMGIDDHYALAMALTQIKGRAALSGYDNPMYDEWLPGWRKIRFKTRQVAMSRGNGLARQEILWINYDPPSVQTQIF